MFAKKRVNTKYSYINLEKSYSLIFCTSNNYNGSRKLQKKPNIVRISKNKRIVAFLFRNSLDK